MKRKLLFLSAIISLWVPVVLGQAGIPSASPSQKGVATTEADALRQQLDMMWKYDQRLLSTVNYGLLAILFVAGAGSVVSIVNARRELNLLRRDFDQTLEASIQRLNAEADKHRTDFMRSSEGRFTELSESIKNAQRTLAAAVDGLEKKVNANILHLEERLNARSKLAIAKQRFELAQLACDFYPEKSNVKLLSAQLDCLEARLEMGWTEYHGPYIQAISKHIEAGAPVYDGDNSRILELLRRLPSAYAADSERLQRAVAGARQKM
jgi:hypothetical protein